MLGGAAGRPGADQIKRPMVAEASDVVGDGGQGKPRLVGELLRACRRPWGSFHQRPHAGSPHGVAQYKSCNLIRAIARSRHRSAGPVGLRRALSISLPPERFTVAKYIREIVASLLPVDDWQQRRDDSAVSDMREAVAKAFGEKLSAARHKAGLSQEELGHLSSVHRTAISELELGRNVPGIDTVIRLAGALGLEPCELMADIRWTPPPSGPVSGNFRRI